MYTLTTSDEELTFTTRVYASKTKGFDNFTDARKAFLDQCRWANCGCIQLWNGSHEIGKLLLDIVS